MEAWEKILGEPHKWSRGDLETLEFNFSDRSGLAYFHFSELHRACLDLSGKALDKVLAFTAKSAIDAVDNTGRTTLSWAAQRGDNDAVRLLLQRGADANRPDFSQRTPLHWSVSAQGDASMLLLLQENADVNAKDTVGRTSLSYVASKKKDVTFMETLLNFEADIEVGDVEGWGPLHWAAHKDQPITLSKLLDHNANDSETDKLGRSPFYVAILRNCHNALQVMVDKGACGKAGKTFYGSTILHIAADHADIESLEILRLANIGNVDITETNNDGYTAQQIADHRRDRNVEWADSSCQACDADPMEWHKAFESFMDTVIRSERGTCREVHKKGREAFDWEAVDEFDGQEVWEDAVESTDESSGPDG